MIRVQEFMDRVGIRNQTELAQRLRLTQSAVSAWGAGVRFPSYETCVDLLKMGMTVSELFGDDVAALVSFGDQASPDAVFDEKVKRALIRILSE